MDRFACGWHRLAGPLPREGRAVRRNHGPGRVPCRNASPCRWPKTARSHGGRWQPPPRPRRPRLPPPAVPAPTRPASPPWSPRRRRAPAGRPATAAARRGGTRTAPARFSARASTPRPAWSRAPRDIRSTGATLASAPWRRSVRAAARASRSVGSWPRSRTAAGRDGAGTSSTGRPPPPVVGSGDGRREGRPQRSAQRQNAVLLVREEGGAHRSVVRRDRPGRGQRHRAGVGAARPRRSVEQPGTGGAPGDPLGAAAGAAGGQHQVEHRAQGEDDHPPSLPPYRRATAVPAGTVDDPGAVDGQPGTVNPGRPGRCRHRAAATRRQR